MPIVKYEVGDLIKYAKSGYCNIAHGCNCFNTMGAGIAKQIKKEFPSAYTEDCKTERGDETKLGIFSHSFNRDYEIYIFNLYTQYHFKGYNNINYQALENAFNCLNKFCIEQQITDEILGIPKIGAGLAGGNWNEIEPIINETTPNLNIIVFLYGK